jgi:hypothetical protein
MQYAGFASARPKAVGSRSTFEMSITSSSRLRVALWGPIAATVLGTWALGVACYRDLYLTSIDLQSDRMDKWDVSAMIEKRRTDQWEELSILSLVVPAVLCFVGPFVGALLSRAEVRRAMLAGMTGAFFAILGFPAPFGIPGFPESLGGPLGVPLPSPELLGAVAGVLMVVVMTLPFAAALGAVGGLAGAAIRRRSYEPEPVRSFVPYREPGETALHDLLREAAILRESLDASTRPMSAGDRTLAFAWVQSAQALPEWDRRTLDDLGLEPSTLLAWIDDARADGRSHIVSWLRHFEATLRRGDGKSAYR